MKNKSLRTLVLAGVLSSQALPLLAQEAATTASGPASLSLIGDQMLMGIAIAVIVGALVAMYRLSSMLMNLRKLELMKEMGIAEPEALPKESWWDRMMERWTDAVPVEKERDIMFDHEYDGITELDNSLPPWWVAMFYVTILFAVVYMTYYHFTGIGASSREQYKMEMEEAEEAVERYLAQQANLVDETNVVPLSEGKDIAAGQQIFLSKCAACHGQLGEGGTGPNMTDPYWIHGGDIKDIFKTIKYGVPEKGMQSWKEMLRPSDMQQVSSYILTLQGTDPPNAKEPEGELHQQADTQPSNGDPETDADTGQENDTPEEEQTLGLAD